MGSTKISDKVMEHMLSAHVLLERIKLKCKKCGQYFNRPKEYNLHILTHLSAIKDDARFVKQFQCPECDLKFVLKSTLEAHSVLHAPFPHICHCGVGYYLKTDLNSHKKLVHADEIQKQLNGLSFWKARALQHELWVPPAIKKDEPKIENEKSSHDSPKSGVRPRLKAELVAKPKSSKKPVGRRGLGIQRDSNGRFKCVECDKTFSMKCAVYVHLKRHKGVKDFACSYCGKAFYDRFALAGHVRTHTGEKPFECQYCGQRFGDPSALGRHRRTHTGHKPYACAVCGMRFSDASGKIVHQRRHDAKKQHACDLCHKTFYNKHDVGKHKASVHATEKNHECKICAKSFTLKQYLVTHERIHQERVRRFQCDHCGLKAFTKGHLNIHIQATHSNVKLESCEECGKKFSCKTNKERHKLYKHSGPRKYECDHCRHKFTNRADIFKHITQFHLNIKCGVCSKCFTSSKDLEAHKIRGCLRCLECGSTFPSKSQLFNHSAIHKNEKRYECHVCLKTFNLKGRLNVHIKHVHDSGDVECNDCGKKFARKIILLNHIFKKHLSYLYCSECMKPFYSVTDLKKHKSKGCSDLKYICDICNMRFRTKSILSVHIMCGHLGMKDYECEYCHNKFARKSQLIRHIKLMHLSKKKSRKRNYF